MSFSVSARKGSLSLLCLVEGWFEEHFWERGVRGFVRKYTILYIQVLAFSFVGRRIWNLDNWHTDGLGFEKLERKEIPK